MSEVVATIGVYGFDAESFRDALAAAGVDLLVDIRRRRGVRGREYAFANARRLMSLLADAGIGYAHRLDLAPTSELLALQHDIDRKGAGVRARTQLAPEYVRRYEREVLDAVDLDAISGELETFAVPALLCVETDAHTCHRSLVARELAPRLHVPVIDLTP